MDTYRPDKVIPVLFPTINQKTKDELIKVLDSGWWGAGSKTLEFEKKFADYVGAKYAVGCNSGTSALDLALKVHGVKSGELITTPLTFVSDAIVGLWNGMDVTFADIDEETLNIDPKSVVVTPQTKAIIAVDTYGRLADVKGLRSLFNHPENIYIIEDAAHACYTPNAGKDADITVWSFQAVKTLPAGDGGAITTNDDYVFNELRKLTWLGIEKNTFERAEGKRYTWNYDITRTDGIKAYMNDLTAVICLGQLEQLAERTAKRRAIQDVYNNAFKDYSWFKKPAFSHTVQYYTPQFDRRDELSEYLAANNIATSVHFKPLYEMTAYKQFMKRPLPVCERVWKKLLSLPCHDGLTWLQIEYIIERVKKFYA